ncbi:hypothetical protein [Ramlibacter sp. PS4R-6]|uniref:hypothetical protein n=1 Tax=Ramlibacter sp. PS4R-6 TaxID=3133438 RepID=UPI0030A8528A
MDWRLTVPLTMAALVAAAGGTFAWFRPAPAPPAPLPVVAHSPPAVLEHCRRAAELLYDVHWAAACFKNDGDNDCMLPDAQAAKVNAILATEEARCLAAESQARASP